MAINETLQKTGGFTVTIKRIDLSRNAIDLYEQKHTGGHLVSEHYHQTHQLLFVLEGEGAIRLGGSTEAGGRRYGADRAVFRPLGHV